MIDEAFEAVIESTKYFSLHILLDTLDGSEVDKYIEYNFRFIEKCKEERDDDYEDSMILGCSNNILDVDEGNVNALRERVEIEVKYVYEEDEDEEDDEYEDDEIDYFIPNIDTGYKKLVNDFETLLKYTKDINKEVIYCLEILCNNLDTKIQCDFAKQLLRYYTDEISTIRDYLKRLSYTIIRNGLFEEAEYFINLMLTININDSDAYWEICLVKMRVTSEDDICNSDVLLQDLPEFNKYMVLVDEDRRKECLLLIKAQKLKKYRAKCKIVSNLIGEIDLYFGHFKSSTYESECHYSAFAIDARTHELYEIGFKGNFTSRPRFSIKSNVKRIWGKRGIEDIYGNLLIAEYDKREGWVYNKYELPLSGLIKPHRKNSGYYEDGTYKELRSGFIETEKSDYVCNCDKEYKNMGDLLFSDKEKVVEICKERKDIVDIVYGKILFADGHIEKLRERVIYPGINDAVQIVQIGEYSQAVLLADGTIYNYNYKYGYEKYCFDQMRDWRDIVTLRSFLNKKLTFIIGVNKYGEIYYVIVESKSDKARVEGCAGKIHGVKLFDNFDTIIEDYEAGIRNWSMRAEQYKESQTVASEQSKSDTKASTIQTTTTQSAPATQTTTAEAPTTAKKQGCYIATCVYGSYDCPEVWVLRRFRDNILRTSWYGNLFVKLYYFVSPKLVKKFGTSRKFCSMWKGVLDKMVNKLKLKEFETTPYQDK